MINQGYYRPQPSMYRPMYPMQQQPMVMHHQPPPQDHRGHPGMHEPKADMAQRRAYVWPNSSCKKYKSVNDFEIIKQFGRGGFSEVFKAKSRKDNQIYALKKIDLLRINLDDYNIIREEIEIHSTIKGKYIVEFIDWFRDGDLIYIVLEFIDGMTLFDYLNRNHPLSEQFVKRVLKQILEGLDVIHKARVIHKDLKPENVLLDENLNAKICDFGWSERLKEVNISGTIVYMAPEILKLEAYSEKVDVWTVGVLVYELFHNVEPFKGDQPQAILQAILTQPLRFDKRCPTEAKALVKYILNIDKNYRPKVEQILNHPYLKDFDINQTLQKPTQNAAHHQLALNSNAQPGPHGNHSGNASKGQHNHGTLHLNHGNHGGNQGSHSGNHGNQNGNFGGYSANQMYQPSQYGSSQQNRNGGGQSTGSANQHAQGGSTPTHAVKPSYDLFENSRRIQPQGNCQGQNGQPSGPGVAGIVGNTLVSASLRAENFKRPLMYSPIGVRPSNTQNTSHPTSNNSVNQTYQIQSHPSNATNVGSPGIQSVQSRSYATLPTRGPSTITINADTSHRSGPQLALQSTGSHPISTVSGTPRHNQGYTTPSNRISSLTSINQQGSSNTTVSGQTMYSLNNLSKPQVISNVGGALLATAKNNPANQQAFQINNDRRA